ncbi:MAG: hypothetical protein ABIC40_09065 [bacterium]
MKSFTENSSAVKIICAIFFVSGFFLIAAPSHAGHMFLEYQGKLDSSYTFYRGVFDLGDIDRDGADEMVIADDEGGYHVYRYTRGGFIPIWISEQVVKSGHIVAVEIIHKNVRGFMPHVLLMDSQGTLYEFRYTGYLFEKMGTYENSAEPNESGRMVITDFNGGERTVLIGIQDNDASNGNDNSDGSNRWGSDNPALSGMIFYKLGEDGLVKLSGDELGNLYEGQVFLVQDLSTEDIDDLMELGASSGKKSPHHQAGSGNAFLADLNQDALLDLILSFGDPDRPVDKLELYSRDGESYTVKVTLELPLINQMVLGDIDGDGFTEIVGLTYDGDVLVYQWDPLTVKTADGKELNWETPHQLIDNTIWMCLGMFEAIGCTVVEEPDKITLSRGDKSVVINRVIREIVCGDRIVLDSVPEAALETIPFFPLMKTLDCLGFSYTFNQISHLIELGEQ